MAHPTEFIGMIAHRAQSEIHPPQGPVIDPGYIARFAQAHEAAGFDPPVDEHEPLRRAGALAHELLVRLGLPLLGDRRHRREVAVGEAVPERSAQRLHASRSHGQAITSVVSALIARGLPVGAAVGEHPVGGHEEGA